MAIYANGTTVCKRANLLTNIEIIITNKLFSSHFFYSLYFNDILDEETVGDP